MTDLTRKFVRPAHAGARIPDLDHGNDLPQEGAEVAWDHYWIGRALSGDVVVVEPEEPAAETDPSEPEAASPAAPAGTPAV